MRAAAWDAALSHGPWGAEFYGVSPLPSEPIVIKHRYSAFTNPVLKALLDERGIRSLLLTGISTDTCVEIHGTGFLFRGLLRDLSSRLLRSSKRANHTVALARFDRDYGAVVSSAEVIDAWQKRQGSTAQAGTHAHV